MITFKLSTYSPVKEYTGAHFFILNKGNHSGKPLYEPCPNCFVCICSSEEEREMLYWLVMGLCQGRVFEQYPCGSVIPFIRKKGLSNIIHQGQKYAIHFLDKFRKNVQALQLLQQK